MNEGPSDAGIEAYEQRIEALVECPQPLKSLISQAGDTGAVCIAVGVNTAADLAQLWQTGIPYVQGAYLQAPLPNMNYEFSDIA